MHSGREKGPTSFLLGRVAPALGGEWPGAGQHPLFAAAVLCEDKKKGRTPGRGSRRLGFELGRHGSCLLVRPFFLLEQKAGAAPRGVTRHQQWKPFDQGRSLHFFFLFITNGCRYTPSSASRRLWRRCVTAT